MPQEIFELKLIFGLKLKELRQEKGVSHQELREKTGLSLSYLSEIENGKKYPKSDKIALLSAALGVHYDELVSLKVPPKLQPIINIIQSDFFKSFPLEEFGLSSQKLIEIISSDPEKINAFLNTVLQVARNFEMNRENFYYAALRSYQELLNNYFPELEDAVDELHLEFPELREIPFQEKVLTEILLKVGVRTGFDEIEKHSALKNLRSIYHPTDRFLHINSGLNSGQRNFLLAREIAFQWLKLKKRPFTTPPHGMFDFEEILNNYQASYFSAALMMPRDEVVRDLDAFEKMPRWEPAIFLRLMEKYDVTPEMIMQRFTNILPAFFDHKNLFFLRFVGTDTNAFSLTKELHLSQFHNPHGNELNEHYCRRWISLNVIKEMFAELKAGSGKQYVIRIQRSQYYHSANEYLCLSIAFPNVSNPSEAMSVTIGLLVDKKLKKRISFLSDPDIPKRVVNTTCERCPIPDCKERAIEPYVVHQQQAASEIQKAIDTILNK